MAISPARSVAARPAMAASPLERLLGRLAGLTTVGVWVDVLLVSMVAGLAGSVRWPHLLLSPQFPSVGDTIMMALDVAQGRAFYFADSAPYLGAPFLWLLALVYKVFGPSLEATQILVWTLGTLTIVPTYLLGREIGGRLTGLVAAALLATSGAHTVITSHVALSHSLTPLVSTTAIWLLARAVRRECRKSLALSGLLAGLALQTHPTVFPLLAGSAVATLLMRPTWLKTRWPYIGLALVAVGYSTLLIYHVQTGFAVIGDIQGKQQHYRDGGADVDEFSDDHVYLKNLSQLTISLSRMASGEINERESNDEYLKDPWVVAYPALALVGAIVAARRGTPLLAVALLLAVFWPPLLSGKYKPILDGRYLMPDVPVLFVDIAIAFTALAGVVARSAPALRVAGGAALLVGATVLVVHPLTLLNTFYEESQEDGFSNALYFRTLRQLEAARVGDEAVLLDPQLVTVKSTGGGKASSSFTFLLALGSVPAEPLDPAAKSADLTGRLAILHRSTADRMDDTVRLEPIDGKRPNGKDSPSYRAYRIGAPETASAGGGRR